jgi:hypothetical protein
MSGPTGLLDTSFETIQVMGAAGASGFCLLEQGEGWCTWTLSDPSMLGLAAGALIKDGRWPHVDLRFRLDERADYTVQEIYVSRG